MSEIEYRTALDLTQTCQLPKWTCALLAGQIHPDVNESEEEEDWLGCAVRSLYMSGTLSRTAGARASGRAY